MNLFNEALKVYEDIYEENPDNMDCLRGLVQIRKDLGMKYQQFSEKLMMLDREEEAKRQYEYAQNQQMYGAGGGNQGPGPQMGSVAFPEMGNANVNMPRMTEAPDMPDMNNL
jgi:tetratricopeptide (TPR) repeat protein